MAKININIKKTDIELNDRQQQVYLKKLGKLQKYFKNLSEVLTDFELGRTTLHHEHGSIYFAKAHITISGNDFYAEASDENIDLAFNQMFDKLMAEIRKHKEKNLIERRKASKIRRLFKGFYRD